MAGLWFDEIADVYDSCARCGLANPRDVDVLELWEIAAVLGLDSAEEATPQQPTSAPEARERDVVAERLYADEHGLPPPQPDRPPVIPPEVAMVIPMRGRGA